MVKPGSNPLPVRGLLAQNYTVVEEIQRHLTPVDVRRLYPDAYGRDYVARRDDYLTSAPVTVFVLVASPSAIGKAKDIKFDIRRFLGKDDALRNHLHMPDSPGGEYTTVTGDVVPIQAHPAVDDDAGHQSNWLRKHHQVQAARRSGPVICDRDWRSALAYAYSAADTDHGKLLSSRAHWASACLDCGELTLGSTYIVFQLDPTTSLQRRANRLIPRHPWSGLPGHVLSGAAPVLILALDAPFLGLAPLLPTGVMPSLVLVPPHSKTPPAWPPPYGAHSPSPRATAPDPRGSVAVRCPPI